MSRTILITGASGGIGRATAEALARRGHRLVLAGRDSARLAEVAAACGSDTPWVSADLTAAEGRAAVVRACEQAGVDTVINNAGVNDLVCFERMDEAAIAAMISANVLSPLALTRALLPLLQARSDGHIVNVGSTFGSIGFPGYVAYSTTKFALRGFSEALRRELADSRIVVQYVAPRATRTGLNSSRADALNRELGNTVDAPATVAEAIVRILDRGAGDYYLGWPEKLFARVNAIAPSLVSRGLRRRLGTVRRYADNEATTPAAPSAGS